MHWVPRKVATHTDAGPPESVIGRNLRILVEGLKHPEGVCWSPLDRLVYAGGDRGELYRFELSAPRAELVCTIPNGSLRGLAADGEGAIYVCDVGNQRVKRVARDGSVRDHGDAIGYPNYPVFDADGNLWVSDSGTWGVPGGAVVRIDPRGVTEVMATNLHFANGLAINDGWLYVVESAWPRITRIPLSGGKPEVVVNMGRDVPDGLAFDEDGGLLISCWQPNRVYRLDSDGTLDVIVDDWSGVYAPTPTNVAFAGPTLDVLVLASLGGDVVSACDPGRRGAVLNYPNFTEGAL